jgi:hypothetical protein
VVKTRGIRGRRMEETISRTIQRRFKKLVLVRTMVEGVTMVTIEVEEVEEVEVASRNLIRVTFNVTIVKNMAILLMSVSLRRKNLRMMQS